MDDKTYKEIMKALTNPGYSKGVPFPEVAPQDSITIGGKTYPVKPVPTPEFGGGLIPEFINGKPTGRMIEAPEGYWENLDPGFSPSWAGGDTTGVDTTATSVNKKNQFFGLELLGALLSLINPNKK
jgi:hypothetical protein